jgi:sulfoxide reductase heme-binding subunit YedZ
VSPVLAGIGHSGTALWYLTRATGLVALIVLSATLVLGIVSSVGWTTVRWPRFLSQAVHRNLSLFCLALVVVHVVTTVADGYVPIGFADAVIPFRSPYRPIWVGLGAVAFDLLLAVAITSGLRRRIGARAWRGVHWLAYLCWPVALLHGLGTGSDARLPGALVVNVLCIVAVFGALGWRLASGVTVSPRWRIGSAVTGVVFLSGTVVFALVGPLRAGWSHRAGTSSALLAQLGSGTASVATSAAGGGSSSASSTPPTTAPTATTGGSPTAPFTDTVVGTYAASETDAAGQIRVILSMHLQNTGLPLAVTLKGPAVNGGVAMTSSQVTLGSQHGQVTSLDGSTIRATVTGSGTSDNLTMQLDLDQATGAVTGTVSGAPEMRSSGREGNDR